MTKLPATESAATPDARGIHSQRGLTLVELMVSMVLGLILIFAATTIYELTKRTTRVQEATARLMENGRAATEILNRSVRMARYFGCAGVDQREVTTHYDTSTPVQSPTTLNGYDQQGIFGVDGTTDEIIVFHALDPTAVSLVQDLTLAAAGDPVKLVTAATNPGAGDMISLTDCSRADVFNISGFSSDGSFDELSYANCATCSHNYLANATVLRVLRERFYIGTGASGFSALFVEDPQDPNDTPLELIEGVEDMQISYGLDTNADGVANQYVSPAVILADCNTSGNAACWRKVTSVRLALLLATVENTISTSPQTYTFNGTSTTATDRRLRREFLSIIAIRNYRP